MPKKKSKEEQKEPEDKEQKEPEKDEDSLEDEIQEIEEKIDTKQFQNFMQRNFETVSQEIEIENSGAPSLEKINPVQRDTFARLEQDVGEGFQDNKKEDDDPFKYNVGAGGNTEEPKYTKAYDEIKAPPKFTDTRELGKGSPFSERQEVARMTYEDEFETVNKERCNPAKFKDTGELGKENSNEKREVKYTPSKY